MKRWMVWDTASGDKVFHDTEEKALQDYKEAVSMVEDENLVGEFNVYLFEVKEHKEISIEDEE